MITMGISIPSPVGNIEMARVMESRPKTRSLELLMTADNISADKRAEIEGLAGYAMGEYMAPGVSSCCIISRIPKSLISTKIEGKCPKGVGEHFV